MCAALAHFPPGYTDEGWLVVMENSPNMEKQSNLTIALQTSGWILQDIGCVNSRHPTINATEGWLSRLNKEIGKCHPNIELLNFLNDDSTHYNFIIQQDRIKMNTPKMARKYIKLDNRIGNTINKFFKQEIHLQNTLKQLSYIVK